MTRVASSGKVGLISFIIVPNDDNFNAIITSPSETIEINCSSWTTAEKIVKKTIKRIEETDNENGRNLGREEG